MQAVGIFRLRMQGLRGSPKNSSGEREERCQRRRRSRHYIRADLKHNLGYNARMAPFIRPNGSEDDSSRRPTETRPTRIAFAQTVFRVQATARGHIFGDQDVQTVTIDRASNHHLWLLWSDAERQEPNVRPHASGSGYWHFANLHVRAVNRNSRFTAEAQSTQRLSLLRVHCASAVNLHVP